MFVKTYGSAVYGVEAKTITIEVNWTAQGKEYCIVGLADSAIKESMQRIESAIKSKRFEMPRTRIVINLAPADLRKSGTAFDLPIAIGILAASEQITLVEKFDRYIMMGELSLDGELRPIRGALPIAIQARKEGFNGFILPAANAQEAAMVSGISVYGMKNIREVVAFIQSEGSSAAPVSINIQEAFSAAQQAFENDFAEVKARKISRGPWKSRLRAGTM